MGDRVEKVHDGLGLLADGRAGDAEKDGEDHDLQDLIGRHGLHDAD